VHACYDRRLDCGCERKNEAIQEAAKETGAEVRDTEEKLLPVFPLLSVCHSKVHPVKQRWHRVTNQSARQSEKPFHSPNDCDT